MTTAQPRPAIGQAIQAALEKHKMSQRDFSRAAGFDTSKSSRLIRGKVTADSATVDAIVQAFPDKETKFAIVAAYLRDVTEPETRKWLSISSKNFARAWKK